MLFPEFQAFPKIGRLSKPIIITEKIDGTNAQIFIDTLTHSYPIIAAGSRKQWLCVKKEDGNWEISGDNYGFGGWVRKHEEELIAGLGNGRHYGEWWGNGIQRNYGLKEKKFSLFNVNRWIKEENPPACCSVVPIIYDELYETNGNLVVEAMYKLSSNGSLAAPGFMKPEGIVVFYTANDMCLKKTFEYDKIGKPE